MREWGKLENVDEVKGKGTNISLRGGAKEQSLGGGGVKEAKGQTLVGNKGQTLVLDLEYE